MDQKKTKRYSVTGVMEPKNTVAKPEPAMDKTALTKLNADPKKFVNPVKPDYASFKYKAYPNKIYVGIEIGDERFPKESKVPPYKKYDDKGNYIKPKFILEKGNLKTAKYSLGKLQRENSLSNPVTNKYERKK